jgi:hypothetical protein
MPAGELSWHGGMMKSRSFFAEARAIAMRRLTTFAEKRTLMGVREAADETGGMR